MLISAPNCGRWSTATRDYCGRERLPQGFGAAIMPRYLAMRPHDPDTSLPEEEE